MPGKIKVKVLAGRNLPVMDRAGDTTDAFVEIKFGGVTHKTDVCRKSLNPHWSTTEWYRFEVDESELQDEPLQLRLMDHDTYSANDAIGKVVISLAPLLAKEANNIRRAVTPGGAVMSGWVPVFDTMHGIRGELNIIVKVELFSDFNKYKTSSCGVQFFHCSMIPDGYKATAIHGFVEELVVNDDPEYQWIDKIRTPRASNEARQVAFIKLSNQVQRLVGVKAAELGANAVVGYQQNFDLEGEAGVVARAIGTAVTLAPLAFLNQPISIPPCTQQQLRQCLDILATDTESITDLNQYFQTHQEELHKLLNILNPKTPAMLDEADNIDDNEKSFELTRQSSVKSHAGNVSIYQDDFVSQKSLRHISDDQNELNKLLKGDTNDSELDSTGPIQKIKTMKTNFFSKRFGSKRSQKSDKQDDQVSIKSNSSDASRLSLTDIKNEFKKFKRLKKPKFRKAFVNADDEGVGMASILARSVIHAHTSLACIAETQDSENSPSSTMRRTSESEPTINKSDEDAGKMRKAVERDDIKIGKHKFKKEIPKAHTSLKTVSECEEHIPQRKLSQSCPSSPMTHKSKKFLKIPEDPSYYGSLSLSEESRAYTSSDEDNESSDQKTDTEKSVETTSLVVRAVLKSSGMKPKSEGQFEMDKSIGDLDSAATDFKEIDPRKVDHQKYDSYSDVSDTSSTVEQMENKGASQNLDKTTESNANSNIRHNSRFKIHNPFSHTKVSKSVSAPSSPIENTSFIYRSSKKIRNQLSKISKTNMIKSLSHYSLIPKKKNKEVKVALSQPGSTSDVPSRAPSETVLGSPFLSYTDLQSLGLDTTFAHAPGNKNVDADVSKVKMYIGSEPASRASISGPSVSHRQSKDYGNLQEHAQLKKDKAELKPTGLVHTAMKTILIDKVQSLLVPTSPEPLGLKDNAFLNDVNKKLEVVEEARKHEQDTKRETLAAENIANTVKPQCKKDSLVHTAIETILLDKVQSLLDPTPDAPTSKECNVFIFPKTEVSDNRQDKEFDTDSQTSRHSKPERLVDTAMKTILIDKVQSLIPTFSEPKVLPIRSSPTDTTNQLSQNLGGGNSLLHTTLDNTENNASMINKGYENKTMEEPGKSNETELINSSTKTQIIIDKSLVSLGVEASNTEDVDEKDMKLSHSAKKESKLVRQDSIHSLEDNKKESPDISKDPEANIVIPCKKSQPVLQHFHPILSGFPLETIPSLPESSFDRSESLDVEGIERTCDSQSECKKECDGDTNSASVCGNSHAACRFNRYDREKESIFDGGEDKENESPRHTRHDSYGGREPMPATLNQVHSGSLTSSSAPVGIHRRSSDSDISVTPKGGSLNTSSNAGSAGGVFKPSANTNSLEMLEYPFLTMMEYPPGFIIHIGGTVCARSVKLMEGGGESATRSAWWAELRTELRSHARALRCNAVVAYSEGAAICEDVCVLSAIGTAALINLDCEFTMDGDLLAGSDTDDDEIPTSETEPLDKGSKTTLDESETESTCGIIHVPYSVTSGPHSAELSTCGGCKRARVPAVLLATCAKPDKLPAYSKAIAITAVATRLRRAQPTAEPGARDISDQLPFLEYELHKLLIAKLRMQGANAIFSLQTQLAIGDKYVMALASGTAVRLLYLPPPTPPLVKISQNDKYGLEIQKALWDAFAANKVINGFDIGMPLPEPPPPPPNPAPPEAEPEELPALNLCLDKDACVLELDEAEEVESAKCLTVRRNHVQAYTVDVKSAPSSPPHAFAQIWRSRLTVTGSGGAGASAAADRHLVRALDGVAYKLRRLQPYAVASLNLHIELPEDEIQLVLSGTAIPLVDPNKPERNLLSDLSHREAPGNDSNNSSFRSNRRQSSRASSRSRSRSRSHSRSHSRSRSLESHSRESRSESSGTSTQSTGNFGDTCGYYPLDGQYGDLRGCDARNRDRDADDADDDIFALDEEQLTHSGAHSQPPDTFDENNTSYIGHPPTAVSLTSLAHVSGARAERRLCALRLLFVRETTAVRELGGLSGFLHTFTCEVLAIARAYTAALGGNALTSFYINQLMLQDNAHKNQGQCLLSVGGDVVRVTF